MTSKILKSRFQPEPHEFRIFKPEIEAFYDAVRNNDYMKQQSLLHNNNGTGLADIFHSDYITASIVNGNPIFTKTRWISYLAYELPSANRKWSNEEKTLIEALCIAIENFGNNELQQQTINYLRTHLKETYKEYKQLIIGQKEKLIELHKFENIEGIDNIA